MNIAVFFKNNLKNIPPNIGKTINALPFSFRPGIGTTYRKRLSEIQEIEQLNKYQQQQFVFNKMKPLVEYAYQHIPFYKHFYKDNKFNPNQLNQFDDIKKIPIITKSILNQYDIEQRSSERKNRYIANTGGTSGSALKFYLEPNNIGNEWAHMFSIWKQLNYRYTDFKLSFIGRNHFPKKNIYYDVVRNSFNLNIYSDYKNIVSDLKYVIKKYKVKYLHGYPSIIYDFATYCMKENPKLQKQLSQMLEGAFLGSEYPHPHYRETIEKAFNINTISWYGHSERCVLASEENEKFRYKPFLSYGFSEAKPIGKNIYSLLATSYHNYASPFIRYNTEDTIYDINSEEGLLNSFKIQNGRSGEFILDKNGTKISLTGLIFGRHHKLFGFSLFIQVKQIEKGLIEIHYVSDSVLEKEAKKYFDDTNLNCDIRFIKRKQPYRTKMGKTPILIQE